MNVLSFLLVSGLLAKSKVTWIGVLSVLVFLPLRYAYMGHVLCRLVDLPIFPGYGWEIIGSR